MLEYYTIEDISKKIHKESDNYYMLPINNIEDYYITIKNLYTYFKNNNIFYLKTLVLEITDDIKYDEFNIICDIIKKKKKNIVISRLKIEIFDGKLTAKQIKKLNNIFYGYQYDEEIIETMPAIYVYLVYDKNVFGDIYSD